MEKRDEKLKALFEENLVVMNAAANVLRHSFSRVQTIFLAQSKEITDTEKESCEAFTARFSRLSDFLFNRVFRTLDKLEYLDEGTGVDRINRMEKRGLISSSEVWKEIRNLRNDIAHEYVIEKSDAVLKEALKHAPELLKTVDAINNYSQKKSV